MLDFLHIENIAVVEHSDISFLSGFNVLTGETGAGKSIIIDALNAVLGARTSKELIRQGCSTAAVSAQFSNIGEEATDAVLKAGYSISEEGTLILSRNMSIDGKTAFRINGAPTTAATLKEIGRHLVNIHGQHDNQSLLNPESHCSFLDKIADNGEQIKDYFEEFKTLLNIRKQLEELEMDEDEKQRKIDILSFQIDELEKAQIADGEFDELREKARLAQNFEKNYKALTAAATLLKGQESDGIIEMLMSLIQKLEATDTQKAKKLSEDFSAIYENLNDAASLLQDYIDNEVNLDYDIEKIGDRIDLIRTIMRKYGGSEAAALEFLQNSRNELQRINFSQEKIDELSVLLEQSEERLIKKASRLTETRKKAAECFERDVCDSLRFLDMPNVRFKVDIKSGKYTKNGCDAVEFLISANAGEDIKPLSKVASGGELSRVMLAIKSILADKDEVGTLIFDEIDTGISGHAATKVAVKLKRVAENRQVICVTHLAQIAAYAQNHMLIEKTARDNRTYTTVKSLEYNGRVLELARIMSGSIYTDTMLNSAKELLDRSFNDENL